VLSEPEVVLRGVPVRDDADGMLDELRYTVGASLRRQAAEEVRDVELLQKTLHDDLAAFVHERLRRRPMVLPVVVEV
jgi:ribonuclease J